ncbi:MAG: FMN-binding protein [Ruminococcus sp.]
MKFRGNPKKYLPALGFLPTAVLAVCIAVLLGDYSTGSVAGCSEARQQRNQRKPQRKSARAENCRCYHKSACAGGRETVGVRTYKDGTYIKTERSFPVLSDAGCDRGQQDQGALQSLPQTIRPYLQNASALLKQIVACKAPMSIPFPAQPTAAVTDLGSQDALQKAGGSSASDNALPTLAAAKSQSNEEPPTVETVEEPAAYRDGVYTGTGTGFGGEMTVQVTVSGGRITDIQILSSKDDSPYLQNASALLQNIIAAQSTNVDAVSGATFSSTGLIEAVRNALANAATGSADYAGLQLKKTGTDHRSGKTGEKGAFPYPMGYTPAAARATASPKSNYVKDGTIEKIHVVSNEDDESFFKRGNTDFPRSSGSPPMRMVSGATFSSDGILEAINEALDAAKNAAQPAVTTTTTVTTIAPPENTTAAPVTGTTSTETTTEPIEKIYDDGTYVGTADCYPDEDEDFVEYVLSVKVKIENDQIVSISDASGAGDSYDKLNDRYISRAAKGTGKITGTIAQILEKQHTDGIDAVSGATCSSMQLSVPWMMHWHRHGKERDGGTTFAVRHLTWCCDLAGICLSCRCQ